MCVCARVFFVYFSVCVCVSVCVSVCAHVCVSECVFVPICFLNAWVHF